MVDCTVEREGSNVTSLDPETFRLSLTPLRLQRMFPRFEFDFSAFLIVDQGVVGFFGRKM
jgi:hypothetical protein